MTLFYIITTRSCLGCHRETLQLCLDSWWQRTLDQQGGQSKLPNLGATTSVLYAPTINNSSGSKGQVEEEERSEWVGINQMW